MAVGFWPREGRQPETRRIHEGPGLDDIEDAIRDADLGKPQVAAMGASGEEEMAGLEAEEGNCRCGAHRHAPDRARRAVDAARDVDRDDRQSACVYRFDQRGELAFDRPGEPRTKERVDDNVSAIEKRRVERCDAAGPKLGHGRRIGREARRIAVEAHGHRKTALGEMPRNDKAIAAIVAGAAKHRDASRVGSHIGHRVGDRPARSLHQRDTGDPAVDRQAIGNRHFLRGQKFNWAVRPVMPNHWASCSKYRLGFCLFRPQRSPRTQFPLISAPL